VSRLRTFDITLDRCLLVRISVIDLFMLEQVILSFIDNPAVLKESRNFQMSRGPWIKQRNNAARWCIVLRILYIK
jgi:hypothetical protein